MLGSGSQTNGKLQKGARSLKSRWVFWKAIEMNLEHTFSNFGAPVEGVDDRFSDVGSVDRHAAGIFDRGRRRATGRCVKRIHGERNLMVPTIGRMRGVSKNRFARNHMASHTPCRIERIFKV